MRFKHFSKTFIVPALHVFFTVKLSIYIVILPIEVQTALIRYLTRELQSFSLRRKFKRNSCCSINSISTSGMFSQIAFSQTSKQRSRNFKSLTTM